MVIMGQFYEQHIKPVVSDIKSLLLRDTQRLRSSVVLIFIAGTLIELTSVVQSYYASKSIRKMVTHNAETELKVKSLEIQKVMTAVETAADNSVWVVEQWLRQPDSLTVSMRRMVKNNKTIIGAGLLFIENYYPEKGKWFEPYVIEHEDGTLEEKQIGSAEHDYFQEKWWNKAINSKDGYWSDPYFDNAGANMMLCSYFVPVHDSRGRTVAVLGADVSADAAGSAA